MNPFIWEAPAGLTAVVRKRGAIIGNREEILALFKAKLPRNSDYTTFSDTLDELLAETKLDIVLQASYAYLKTHMPDVLEITAEVAKLVTELCEGLFEGALSQYQLADHESDFACFTDLSVVVKQVRAKKQSEQQEAAKKLQLECEAANSRIKELQSRLKSRFQKARGLENTISQLKANSLVLKQMASEPPKPPPQMSALKNKISQLKQNIERLKAELNQKQAERSIELPSSIEGSNQLPTPRTRPQWGPWGYILYRVKLLLSPTFRRQEIKRRSANYVNKDK